MPRKKMVGIVIADKLDKTRTVLVTRLKQHRRYKKFVRVRKKYLVHDEGNSARVGDLVLIKEFRPISLRKRFVIEDILARGVGPEIQLTEDAGIEELSKFLSAQHEEAKALQKPAKEPESAESLPVVPVPEPEKEEASSPQPTEEQKA